MKYYSYDYSGFFINEGNAEFCQVTEQKKALQAICGIKDGEEEIQSEYIFPSYSTTIAPPEVKEGFQAKFNGESWEVEEIPKPEIKPEEEPYVQTYADKRAAEYPSIYDYIDGIVKGDEKQVSKYISDCLKVKKKFPKE